VEDTLTVQLPLLEGLAVQEEEVREHQDFPEEMEHLEVEIHGKVIVEEIPHRLAIQEAEAVEALLLEHSLLVQLVVLEGLE
jgi:hypothetical protein